MSKDHHDIGGLPEAGPIDGSDHALLDALPELSR